MSQGINKGVTGSGGAPGGAGENREERNDSAEEMFYNQFVLNNIRNRDEDVKPFSATPTLIGCTSRLPSLFTKSLCRPGTSIQSLVASRVAFLAIPRFLAPGVS